MRSVKSKQNTRATSPKIASSPTPCVLDLWEQGVDRYESFAAGLARLVVRQPRRVGTLIDPKTVERSFRLALKRELVSAKKSKAIFWLSAIAQFLDWQGRTSEAADLYRQSFEFLKSARSSDHDQTLAVARELDRVLRRLGREKEAWLVGHELRVAPLMDRDDEASLSALRDAAFNAFEAGYFTEAEAIYRHLLARNFDRMGTHCHLARALLALGREAEAMAEVSNAWECPAEGEPYIVARTLYLKALLTTLASEDADRPLTMLKEVMQQNPEARHSWLMAPVLDRLQPRLTTQSYAFFARLALQLSGNSTE